MVTAQTRFRTTSILTLLSGLPFMLTACGGGGSTTSTTPNLPPASIATLAHWPTPVASTQDTVNASISMTALAMTLPDNLLRISDFAAMSIRVQQHGFATLIPCGNGGQISWIWNDTDNNKQLSIGDTLTATLQNCSLTTASLQGTLALTLTAPTNPATANSAFNARLNLQQYDSASATWIPVSGAFNAQIMATPTTYNTVLTLDSSGTSYADSVSPSGSQEVLHDATITRNLDLQGSRYNYAISGTIDSATLSDRITLSTPTPLQGYLDTFPDGGTLSARSSRFATNLVPNPISDNYTANLFYATSGSSTPNSVPIQTAWRALADGFAFNDPLVIDMSSQARSLTWINNDGQNDSFQFLGIFELNSNYDPKTSRLSTGTPSFILQFNHPLAPTTPTISVYPTTGLGQFTLTSSVNGAQVLATANTPLAAGTYSFNTSGYKDLLGFGASASNMPNFIVPAP